MVAGLIALFWIALVGFGSLAALVAMAGGPGSLPFSRLVPILETTALQATLSTVLSLGFGALLALALARRRFPGRRVVVSMLGITSTLPAIVVVFAITSVLGRGGLINDMLASLGVERFSIYGLHGVILAHVFFNATLAARVYLGALEAIPGEHWRLATTLSLPPLTLFRVVDRPMLWRETPALALLIFLLCATSFAIPLTLGGGPGAATLEVALYEALRFEADFPRAAALALTQVGLLGLIVALAVPLLIRPSEIAAVGRAFDRPDATSLPLRWLDCGILVLVAMFYLPPLIAILSGLSGLPASLGADLLTALATSLLVAIPSAILALSLALALAWGRVSARRKAPLLTRLFGLAPLSIIALPTMVVAAGLFSVAQGLGDPSTYAIPMMILVNGLIALPFVHRLVEPPILVADERYDRLAQSLRLERADRWRVVEGPTVIRPAVSALALAMALSLGDLGVAAMFGSGAVMTLPLQISEALGAYRIAEAQGIAALLACLVIGLFWISERAGGALADPR